MEIVLRRRIAFVSVVAALAVAGAWPATAFAYGSHPTLSTSVSSALVDPCGATIVSGSGFQPAEIATLVLDGPPVKLGTTTAGPTGSFSTTVSIPSGTAAGQYNLVSNGSDGDSAMTAITIGSGGCGVTTAAVSTGLAFTGADIAALAGVGAVALGMGGVLLLLGRRRRQSTESI